MTTTTTATEEQEQKWAADRAEAIRQIDLRQSRLEAAGLGKTQIERSGS